MNRPTTWRSRASLLTLSLAALLSAGCTDPADNTTKQTQAKPEAAPAPSNRIDVPAAVRKNLGIEFTKVERRHVAHTLRLPAQIQLLPSATQHYRAPLAGRVTVHVEPLQKVEAGDLLYTLDSHQWRDLQRELGMAANKLTVTDARLQAMAQLVVACEEHEASLRNALAVTKTYLVSLERAQSNVGGQGEKLANVRVEQARLAAQIAEASEKHTETQTRIKEFTAMLVTQRDHMDLLLAGAGSMLGVNQQDLSKAGPNGKPGWRALAAISIRAARPGIVDTVSASNGNLVDAFGEVLTTVDPTRVRCHARALQADLASLQQALMASPPSGPATTIVPASRTAADQRVAATVQLSPTGNSKSRTIDVYALPASKDLQFVRPGMAVFLEIVTSTTQRAELAIPKSCILPDGLDRVFFRRDPRDPDKVIRVVADIGDDNGQWVTVLSGIRDGDDIVLAGAFELVLASSDQTPKGGHFHADGSWHADGEDHE